MGICIYIYIFHGAAIKTFIGPFLKIYFNVNHIRVENKILEDYKYKNVLRFGSWNYQPLLVTHLFLIEKTDPS